MKNLFKSLAAFQQEVPTIHKGTQGYGYSYADLPAIFEIINPLLKRHGLGFTQLVGFGEIKTIIFHESGESIETITNIPQNVQLKGMNEFQVLGSAITYIRRYALSAALGLVTDKDTDAAGEQIPNDKPAVQPMKPSDDKPWLNKGEPLAKAKEFIKGGGTIADIEKKYKLSKEIRGILEAEIKPAQSVKATGLNGDAANMFNDQFNEPPF